MNALTTLLHTHKARTIHTLTRWVQLVCDSRDSLADEREYLDNVFSKNDYNCDFVRHNTYRALPKVTNSNTTPVTTATIPYIKGTSETIARILQPYNTRVAHKAITTLRELLMDIKDKDEPKDREGAVYKEQFTSLITIGDHKIKNVRTFKYLGYTITNDEKKTSRFLYARIGAAY